MGPIREWITKNEGIDVAEKWDENQIRPVKLVDFLAALKSVKSSVGPTEIVRYKDWNSVFGTFQIPDHD